LRVTTTNFRTEDDAYALAVGTITSNFPEIAACCYNGKLYVYSRTGQLNWSLNWSTDLTCLALANVQGNDQTSLIAGSIDGTLRVISSQGKSIWKKRFDQPITTCGVGDIDDDGADEVVIGLENNEVIFLDNDSQVIWRKQHNQPIINTLINDFNNDGEVEVITSQKNGIIHLYSSSGTERFRLSINERISAFTVIRLPQDTLFVTSHHSEVLKFWTKHGELINSYRLPRITGKISFLTAGPLFDSEVDVVILSGDNDIISIVKFSLIGQETIKNSTNKLKEINPKDLDLAIIKEIILSITFDSRTISLETLDRAIRNRLQRKVDYNLREIILEMLQKEDLKGSLKENTFYRKVSSSYNWKK
jgi:hypothetical protein